MEGEGKVDLENRAKTPFFLPFNKTLVGLLLHRIPQALQHITQSDRRSNASGGRREFSETAQTLEGFGKKVKEERKSSRIYLLFLSLYL